MPGVKFVLTIFMTGGWKFYVEYCPVSGLNIRAWLYVRSHSSTFDFRVYFCFSSCVTNVKQGLHCKLIKWLFRPENISRKLLSILPQ